MFCVFQFLRYSLGMRDSSDEQLMQQYATGDALAFEEIYQRYRAPLFRYIQRQVRDPAVANDLYQGSWEKLIKARKQYRPTAPFRAWLFRIAHNHMIDHFRATRETEPLADEFHVSTSPQPSDVLAVAQKEASFRAALEQLPAEQKQTVLLKIEAGLNIEEIGKITGVEPETVKSRLRYAVAKLKRTLQT
ncbi:MAG: RNA polymerase sigma factor (sigma-70 family) [Rhodothermales bacterium]|jgi:RNA polymerase sigma factor (sigma-70 family)